MYYVHSFLTQLCLLSLETLKQTTYLLLKCTAKMFAFCGQQRLNLASGTCAIPRLRAVVVFVKPTPYVFKWRKKCRLNGASCPCHLLQVGCSCQTHTWGSSYTTKPSFLSHSRTGGYRAGSRVCTNSTQMGRIIPGPQIEGHKIFACLLAVLVKMNLRRRYGAGWIFFECSFFFKCLAVHLLWVFWMCAGTSQIM